MLRFLSVIASRSSVTATWCPPWFFINLFNNRSYSTSMALSLKRKLESTSSDFDEDEFETLESLNRTSRPAKTTRTIDSSGRSISPPKLTKLRNTIVNQHSNELPRPPRRIDSPIKLTRVDGLPEAVNVDTIGLEDILGNPLIKQCWAFNYLIDVDFLL